MNLVAGSFFSFFSLFKNLDPSDGVLTSEFRKLLEIDAVHESLREPSFENKSNSLQLSNAVDGVLLLEFVDELLRRRRRRHSWRGDA